MVITGEEVIAEINAYMQQHGGPNAAWYVGIASNPRDRLFNDHNVIENPGVWICRDAGSSFAARQIEQAYLDAGCDGGVGGGDLNTVYVYAYRKTLYTTP